jgi:hypothetical protein
MPFSKPIEKQQEVDGRVYNVVIFQTAISAAKAGTLEIAPATIDSQVQVPSRSPSGFDDFFGGFFGNMMSGDIRQITVRTQSTKLEVKPLPDVAWMTSAVAGPISLQARRLKAGFSRRVRFRSTSRIRRVPTRWRPVRSTPRMALLSSRRSSRQVLRSVGFNGEKRFEFMIARTPVENACGATFVFDPLPEKCHDDTAIEVTARNADPRPWQQPPQLQVIVAASPAAIQRSLLVHDFSPVSFRRSMVAALL